MGQSFLYVQAKPNHSPTQWVRFGEEEQRSERVGDAKKRRRKRYAACDDVVELRGIEPLSESNLTGTSPGADDCLHSLTAPGIVTLYGLVASSCMVRAKLNVRTVTTQITPEPGSWSFRGGWAAN